MIRWVLQLRSKLPAGIWCPLRRFAWALFWRKEELKQTIELRRLSPRLSRSERAVLAEAIGDTYPFSSLLEIGCSYGQTISLLAPLFPRTKIIGLDHNALRLAELERLAAEKGWANIEIREGTALALTSFPDRGVDVVYSCASLLYIRADEIERATAEMVRVCSKRLFFLEQHVEDDRSTNAHLGRFVSRDNGLGGYWLRNYRLLFERICPSATISVKKVPEPLWIGERWQEFAHLISVTVAS